MLLRKHKNRGKLGIVKLENRLLGFIRRDTGFISSFNVGKDRQITYDEFRKETENALLQIEYNKAKANMTAQQVHSFS